MTVGTFSENNATEPAGAIQLWHGDPSNIPAGWAVCDGNNGTPDLRSEFARCITSSDSSSGGTGGQHSYTLSKGQLPSHNHSLTVNSAGSHAHDIGVDEVGESTGSGSEFDQDNDSADSSTSNTAGSHSHSFSTPAAGSGSSVDNQPNFQTVHYIMKL